LQSNILFIPSLYKNDTLFKEYAVKQIECREQNQCKEMAIIQKTIWQEFKTIFQFGIGMKKKQHSNIIHA
jgi:hypothetical protein